ncbi:hypothetical protein J3E68DRAFT_290990 [Trichoderma sp. SZMC 28012]
MSIIFQRRDWPRPCKTAPQAALWSASLLPLLCAFPLQSANTSRCLSISQSPTPTAANSCGRDGRARANSAKTAVGRGETLPPAAGAGRQKPFEQRPRRSCSFSLRICHCMLMQLVQFRKCSACCVLFAFAPPTPVGDFGLALRVRELIAWPNCASLSCPSLQLALCHSTTTTPPLPLTAEEIENVLSSSLRLARFSLSLVSSAAAASPLLPPPNHQPHHPHRLPCHCYFKHPLASASASPLPYAGP